MKLLSMRAILVSFLTVLIYSDVILILCAGAAQIGNQWSGPWVDRIVYKIIQDDTEQIHALIDGEVDIIGGQLDPAFLDQLYDAEDVEVSKVLRFGYGITEINCAKYPMNITNFRRAVAFALDKHRIIEEGWLGLAELLDCYIPRQHPASIEDEMSYHYYDENITEGVRLLELEGFIDSDGDGWREGPGPDGPGTVDLHTIFVEGPQTTQISLFLDIVVQALTNLNIRAESRYISIYDYGPQFDPVEYDMVFHGKNWHDFDLDSYAREFFSYSNNSFHNLPHWSNNTWNMLANVVLTSTDYNEIIEAVKQMEHIWVHSCPAIVMYQNYRFTAYKSDNFEGVVSSIIEGAPNYYTNLRVHKKEDTVFGGTYTWANPLEILSFNHYSINSAYADNVLQMLFDPMVRIGPDGNNINWMCDDFSVLTHSDDRSVPDGHTRILIDVVQNATWSDGTPVTAEDFAFTWNFIRDHVPEVAANLVDMVACYAPTAYQLFCEFNSESYWHWHSLSYQSVIPKQVWTEFSGDYDEYQPNSSTIDEMIVSGAFIPVKWKIGDYIELVQNPTYFRNPRNLPTTTSAETTTTRTPILPDIDPPIPPVIIVGGILVSLLIILTIDYRFRKHKPLKYTDRRTQFGD